MSSCSTEVPFPGNHAVKLSLWNQLLKLNTWPCHSALVKQSGSTTSLKRSTIHSKMSLLSYMSITRPLYKWHKTLSIFPRQSILTYKVKKGCITLVHVNGVDNPTDILTKPLAVPAHEKCVKLLGLSWSQNIFLYFLLHLPPTNHWCHDEGECWELMINIIPFPLP